MPSPRHFSRRSVVLVKPYKSASTRKGNKNLRHLTKDQLAHLSAAAEGRYHNHGFGGNFRTQWGRSETY